MVYYILVHFFKGGPDMQRNTSVTLGDHFSNFIKSKISQGRFDNTSEAVRAGLRLLEVEETKLEALRAKLAEGEAQLDKGQGIDGQSFMDELIG
jgi:antitoxin ParD1/3/4